MPAPDSTLTLLVGGRRFGGWLDVSVQRGVKHAAASFDISCTQRWPGQDARFEIPEGVSCEIWIGRDKVITGYVDAISTDRDATNASCRIHGRSKTCDLIDCSPDFPVTQFNGQDVAQVARTLAEPFGVDVVAPEGIGKIVPVSAAHKGETVWKVVERLARQYELLVMDDEHGRLVLARLADEIADDSLVHPSDGLKKISTKRDSSKRFSVYRVKAQAGGAGAWSGAGQEDAPATAVSIAHVTGEFRDEGVTRYRPKTILNEGAAKKTGAMARAEWECRHNIGQALKVDATRIGWRQSSGRLWRSNMLVSVVVPAANIDARLAIAKVHYKKSASEGEVCELELMPPDALTTEPPEQPAGKAGGTVWNGAGKHD